MEVAVPEEPQKKIFRARKTMKMSDRQQLDVLHSTLASTGSNASSPSSRPETPLVNGTHVDDGQEMDKENGSKSPTSECSQPPSRNRSRSSSPAGGQNVSSSPTLKDSESSEGDRKKEDEKEDVRPETPKDKKTEISKSTSTESVLASDSKRNIKQVTVSNGEQSMDTDNAGIDQVSTEEKNTKSSSSSPSGSPATSLECDPEVKEGFLCLSEEDEGQGEHEEVKEEKMDVEVKKEVEKGGKAADGTAGNSTPVGKKRALSPVEMNEDSKDKKIKEERDGKRARVEGVQLEAQLELKITANGGSRLKLQKVVQQLVEERLRVLQLTVFDRNLQELKDRVDKIDATTKQQNTVQNTLQSKIARLAKKFGAANQATENSKKAQEPPVVAKAAPVANTTPTTQRTVRTTLDQKLLPVPPGSSSSTATPTQPKPLSTPTTPTSSALGAPAPILQIISTTTNSTPSSSSSSLSGQAQTGTLLLQPRTNTGGITNNTATTAGQPVSIQPLLIQLPLAMANGQGGAIAGGVGLIPVSSLASVSSISKAKTTTATTFILQKSPGNLVPSSSSTSLSTTVTQMPQNRMVYQGGTVTASSPSAGISVSTARAPAQSAAVVGMATVSSSPAATGPAATGSAAAVNGPPSASEMASKTDNQATNLAPAKSAAQPGRPKGSVIDLTEDDDDVQVTSVQKAAAAAAASANPTTPRAQGPTPSLVSSTSVARPAVQHRPSVDSPSKSRSGSTSGSTFPPLPIAPPPPTRLPVEASHTSPPQQPQLKLARVQSQNGIVLSWCVSETERNVAPVDSYHLYAYHQDQQAAAVTPSTQSSSHSLWKKIGEVKALPLPMACTLTQFVSGSTYYFAVRAKDVYGRFGPFCEPQCTDVINSPTSSAS